MFLQGVAAGIEDLELRRQALDAAAGGLLKMRMAITKVPTLVNLATGESAPIEGPLEDAIEEAVATKH